jgi:phosphoserine phosphatase
LEALNGGFGRVAYRRRGRLALVVDLDGTLVRSDLLVESVFAFVGTNPWRILEMIGMLARGKAALKAGMAAATAIHVTHLPYEERVVALITSAGAEGRKVYLASASNERYVEAVAAHVGVEGWFASTSAENLSSYIKARRPVEAFGEKGFDYVGNDHADLAVWAVARCGVAVAPSRSVRTKLAAIGVPVDVVEPIGGRVKAWIKLVRVHQWAKKGLVFVALLTSQKFDAASLAYALGAFLAFSFAASAVYILQRPNEPCGDLRLSPLRIPHYASVFLPRSLHGTNGAADCRPVCGLVGTQALSNYIAGERNLHLRAHAIS